jgi:hypothetical protein
MEKLVERSPEQVNIIKTMKKIYFYYYKTVKTFSKVVYFFSGALYDEG